MSAVDAVRRLAGESADAAGLVLEGVTVKAAGRRRIVRVVVDLPGEATGGDRWTPSPRCRSCCPSGSTTPTPWAAPTSSR